MAEKYLGESIKKLGFGFMRLPEKSGEIDIERTIEMVDYFMDHGFTYFDTAYVYNNGKSEEAICRSLTSRYPREAYQLADKLPLWNVKTTHDLAKLFDTSLKRTQAGYFDYYLLHALSGDNLKKAEDIGAWEFLREMKRQGHIKHYGFSFHDTAEKLDEYLTRHPDTEFVQLQINYADWEDEQVQSRKCYEVARKHGKPIIIMEPVKGGGLATEDEVITRVFKKSNPNASVASWAIRYAASLDGLITVLSGMSTFEQVKDNVEIMENFTPLTEEEREVIKAVVRIIDSTPNIPCTECRYCMEHCPQEINIPNAISSYNMYLKYKVLPMARRDYMMGLGHRKASECAVCHACEEYCPQHIAIADVMGEVAELFE